MSAKIPSVRSLNIAIAHALGIAASAPSPSQEHNVGDCPGGCGGSGRCGGGNACVCAANPGVAGGIPGLQLPPGWSLGQGGVVVMPNGQPAVPVSTVPPPVGSELPIGPQFNAGMWNAWVNGGFAAMRCVPYEDAVKDGLLMSIVQSDPTTIGAGLTVNVDIQALNGWVDGYYLDTSARTAAGAALPAESYSMTPPRNVGCPAPSCTRDVATSGRFFRSDNGCCLGKPFRSILTEQANGTPLRAAVTNHTGADMVFQMIVRGFCNSTRVCV